MTQQLSSFQVWQLLEKQIFAVLGVVTANQEARTVGVVYVVHQGKLYISTQRTAWKARHIVQNPHISMTIPIHKSIPFLPWIKIPAATVTFSGVARICALSELSADILHLLFRGMEKQPQAEEKFCVIEVTPEKEFITYGVGVSLSQMRDPAVARGRAPVYSTTDFSR